VTRRRHRPLLLVVLAAGLPLVAACGADEPGSATGLSDGSGDPAAPTEIRGIVREPLPEVGALALPDASNGGEEFSFVAEDGEILLAYFGYTHCPDVCPTTLADVRTALQQVGDDADRVDLAMATIDPDRDTGEVLPGYVQSFVPDAHALVATDDADLRAAADAFGADYSVEAPSEAGGEPEVSHTGFLYAVDDAGRLQVTWSFGTPAEDIANDLQVLLADA
jgi:protein SCO1/2